MERAVAEIAFKVEMVELIAMASIMVVVAAAELQQVARLTVPVALVVLGYLTTLRVVR
jgi:hypothetical protein